MTTTLLCLHGMACTGRVWDAFAAAWSESVGGPLLAPDLAGHGSAPRLESYSIDRYADELVGRLGPSLSEARDLVVVGHSMGGVVGASLLRQVRARALVAIGIKTSWSVEEVAGTARVADKGVRWFEAREEAEGWFLKVSGLHGIVATGTDIAASGVVAEKGRYRLTTDPEAYRGGQPPPFGEQLEAIDVVVRLGRGERDEMVPAEQVRPFDPDFVEFPGAGHSAHVEQPQLLVETIQSVLHG